jgi:uncharacterized protein involved in exopolysaccharide biosynthesis
VSPYGWTGTPLTLGHLLEIVRRHWKRIAILVTVSVLVTLLLGLFQRRAYACRASFMPQSGPNPSGLSGVAAQFGVALPGGDPTNSPQFYVDLTRSRELLGTLVDSGFVTQNGGRQVRWRLEDAYRVKDKAAPLRRDATIRALTAAVNAVPNPKTGVVNLTVTAPDPQLACAITGRLLTALNTFNLTRRQSQAAAERKFIDSRLVDERRQLNAAESLTQDFLRRNRDIRSSPQLTFEYDRLNRDLTLHQQLYMSLTQSLEQSRIDEFRDTPLITVVENPEVPVRPAPRGLLQRMIAVMIGAVIVGVFGAVGMEYVGWQPFAPRDAKRA